MIKSVDKSNKPYHVRYVDQETRDRFNKYAKRHKLQLAQVLEVASKKL